ncbi:MAG: glycoside hydrolase family 127 protein [Bacteroidales bacterium]|nr:glycoside hydrolase family 127 protein [Bacteroidales bacterium]
MKRNLNKIPLVFIMLISLGCANNADYKIRTEGPEVVKFKAMSFSLTEVRLLDGPFWDATLLNKQSLLNYDPDRLLAKFRLEAGLKAKAPHYEGWESNTVAGHSLGHYLSAISMMYQTTGDEQFLDRVNYIVEELKLAQEADGDGYLGAFPDGKRILEEEVANGDIRSQGFDLNGIWVPYYTEHKVMAGLFDAYYLCKNKDALEINIKFADWLETVVSNLNDSSIQVMLDCEHGGINESLAELYELTGEERYLNLSYIFHHKSVLDPLGQGVDILPGIHANTTIPKLIGLARRYELTGNEADRKAAEFFWKTVVNHHSYATGGNGNHEYFGKPDELSNRLSSGTTESCNVYNMLKLSTHLFGWEASPEVADYYERALFNHILSSQHPEDGRVIYNLSLEMGGHKEYQNPYWFTCCVGTGMENHSKYARNIFYHNDRELYVSQFIASELTWKDKGMVIRQVTAYPEEHGSTLEIACEKPTKTDILIRYPYWAKEGIDIKINGKSKKIKEAPGSFVRLSRKWKDGDVIDITMPFSLWLDPMPDNENRVAIMYGPLVMAGDLGTENDPNYADPMYVPVFITDDKEPANWFDPISGKSNTFRSKNAKPRNVTIKPFYLTHERRYTVYWDLFTQEGWSIREQEYKEKMERLQKIREITIDFAQLGEMQPEREHNFDSNNSDVREFKGKKLRESRGGWFSVDMAVTKSHPTGLVVEYWGGFPGSKTFDILIDDVLLVTQNISNMKDGEFVHQEYEIPEEMTVNKTRVTVKFKAHKGHMAGPVFSVSTINR